MMKKMKKAMKVTVRKRKRMKMMYLFGEQQLQASLKANVPKLAAPNAA